MRCQTALPRDILLQLPTIAKIRASTAVLTLPGTGTTVVRIGERFAVKFGPHVELREAESMRFVSDHCRNISLPKVYGTLTDEASGEHFIVMEYIDGDNVEKLLPSLTKAEKADICRQLKNAVDELRSLPSHGYIGSVGQMPCLNTLFWTPPPFDASCSVPFDTESEMNKGLLRCLARIESASYITFLRSLVKPTLRDHRVCFAHADLQAKNIMITGTLRKVDVGNGGDETRESDVKVHIIDWELAEGIPSTGTFVMHPISPDSSQPGKISWAQAWMHTIPST